MKLHKRNRKNSEFRSEFWCICFSYRDSNLKNGKKYPRTLKFFTFFRRKSRKHQNSDPKFLLKKQMASAITITHKRMHTANKKFSQVYTVIILILYQFHLYFFFSVSKATNNHTSTFLQSGLKSMDKWLKRVVQVWK